MFKGLGNFATLMKQAQQIGSRMQGLSEELKGRRATGSAGGGMVEIEVNGLGEVLACRIDPKLWDQQDRELLEDLVTSAANQAQAKARELHAEAMQGLTGDLDVPGLQDALGRLTGDEK
jgi:DNA-binding YbaB/EbfC family protein